MMAIKADFTSTTFGDNKTGIVYRTILLLLVLKQGTTYWRGRSRGLTPADTEIL